jgi:hypothetical protein
VFLSNKARVDTENDPSLTYGLTMGVRTPDYEVVKKFWPDTHFEGGYLFQDTMIVKLTPPLQEDEKWIIISTGRAANCKWQYHLVVKMRQVLPVNFDLLFPLGMTETIPPIMT